MEFRTNFFFSIWCSNIFRHSWALWFGIWNVSIDLHSYLYSLKQHFSVGHYRLRDQIDGIAPGTPRFILNPWVLSSSNTVLVIPCFQKSPWCAWHTVRPKKPKCWSRESFIAGPHKETSGWCPKSSELLTDSAHCIWSRDTLCWQRSLKSKLWFSQLSCVDVRVGPSRRLSTEELMLLNCGVGDSWQCIGLQGNQTRQS